MARILVVDDAALIRMKCSKLLIDNGYDVIEAKNGAEAIEKYKEFNPDGVLLNIIMPEMRGIAALRETKKIDPVARVAMLSAMGQRNMVMGALKDADSGEIGHLSCQIGHPVQKGQGVARGWL